ncbi:MAG: GNAT family N-acetyltransferase [Sphingobium sp.]|nr:GNAT family N-acetyltransferase [Sphingobium sp.]
MPAEATGPAIRRAGPDDAVALAALKLATFRETFIEGFGIPYPPADLARFETETYSPAKATSEITDPAHATWVCEDADGALLAYAHCGPCKLPHPDVTAGSGELYQIYILKSAQGMGLGRDLLRLSLDWIAEIYPGPQWLGVWSGNLKAQRFYRAMGFSKVGDYHFMVGDHRDDEYIYRRG